MMEGFIYLDNAATSWPKPEIVIREMKRAFTEFGANAGRSGHGPSLDSARIVFKTREMIASLFCVELSENIVFTRGATEGLNLILKGFLKAGDSVAVSPLEHNSVMRPLIGLKNRLGVKITTLPADNLGKIDLDSAKKLANETRFDLVVINHGSNVNGVVQDIEGIRSAFPETPILLDAAQTAGVLPIDVKQTGIDSLACSAHKGLLGPTGVGVCYISPEYKIAPLIEGGTGSMSESVNHPLLRPDVYEAGTLNLHGIAGTFGAMKNLEKNGLIGAVKRELTLRLIEGLADIPGINIFSPSDGTALCLSFTLSGTQPEEVAFRLEKCYSVLCRPGLQCSPSAHKHIGTAPQGTVRFSPGWGNTKEQIDRVVEAVHDLAK